MTEAQSAPSQLPDLPLYDDQAATQSSSFVRSFSLFSLFKPSNQSLDKSLLTPLHSLTKTPPPTPLQVSKALASFNKYIETIKKQLAEPDTVATQFKAELVLVLGGYTKAFESATKVAWVESATATRSLVKSLETSLVGLIAIYSCLSAWPVDEVDQVVKEALEDARKALLGSPFQAEEGATHTELTGLFERPRTLVTNLQTALRPLAHAKLISRGSPPPNLLVTDHDALEIISLLDLFAELIGTIDKLSGRNLAKTKAQKEEDARRPLRLALEAKVLKCDVIMSMANRDINRIKKRALGGLPKGDDLENENIKPVFDEDGDGSDIRWENKVEAALIECLGGSTALVEERRGSVLSDKIERADWLEEQVAAPPPARRSLEQFAGDEDSDEDWADNEDEESESVDEAINTYPCPLRSLFRLHDRYEEQRLAVWLSLPTSSRGGMGTYMRGTDGRVGEAWDNLGLLLQLDYDGATLLSMGLSVDKLDKWIDLASKRNAKKIRRRRGGRKTM